MKSDNKLQKQQSAEKIMQRKKLWIEIKRYRQVYLFVIPMVVSVIIFSYIPMTHILIAFEKYSYKKGILGSPWVGLKHFRNFLGSYEFWQTVRNTITITLMKLVICFPAPILFALLLNEVETPKFKRAVQTFSYLPYFVSWIVVVQLMNALFTPYGGVVNEVRKLMGMEPLFIMGMKSTFYPLLIGSDIWKNIGWSSIVYLAAISGVDQELYEAAEIDGADRLRRVWHITLPSLRPTVVLLFIMQMGSLLSVGYDQVLLLQQPTNLELSQVLDTYVIRVGLRYGNFELATAIGIVKSIFSLVMVVTTNAVSRKVSETCLW